MVLTITDIPYSHASTQLGMNVTSVDSEQGILVAEFIAKPDFENRVGNIQGGFLVAMLDDLMGYALGVTLPPEQFAPTANLNVSFLRPAKAGYLHGEGGILKREGDVFHLASKIYNSENQIIASATAKAKLTYK